MELYILIEAGRIIGLAPTVGLIMMTGVAGAWLARSQGVEILRRIQEETSRGQMPATTLIDGALILVGGLLLLTAMYCSSTSRGFAPIRRRSGRRASTVRATT